MVLLLDGFAFNEFFLFMYGVTSSFSGVAIAQPKKYREVYVFQIFMENPRVLDTPFPFAIATENDTRSDIGQ